MTTKQNVYARKLIEVPSLDEASVGALLGAKGKVQGATPKHEASVGSECDAWRGRSMDDILSDPSQNDEVKGALRQVLSLPDGAPIPAGYQRLMSAIRRQTICPMAEEKGLLATAVASDETTIAAGPAVSTPINTVLQAPFLPKKIIFSSDQVTNVSFSLQAGFNLAYQIANHPARWYTEVSTLCSDVSGFGLLQAGVTLKWSIKNNGGGAINYFQAGIWGYKFQC